MRPTFAAAAHEAGHAVCAIAQRLRVAAVCVCAPPPVPLWRKPLAEQVTGYTLLLGRAARPPWRGGTLSALRRELAVIVAGALGERRAGGAAAPVSDELR